MYYSVSDTGKLGKRKSEFSYQESNPRPSNIITSSDALPLSYRRLVGAKAIKLRLKICHHISINICYQNSCCFYLIERTLNGQFFSWMYRYEGWVAGYQAAYDTAKSKLIANNFSFGYRSDDFNIHSSV